MKKYEADNTFSSLQQVAKLVLMLTEIEEMVNKYNSAVESAHINIGTIRWDEPRINFEIKSVNNEGRYKRYAELSQNILKYGMQSEDETEAE